VSSATKLLRDYGKLMMELVEVTAVTIQSTQVPANSSVELYDDTGDLIFIYIPNGMNPNLSLQITSDVVSYSLYGSKIYSIITSIITSGRTVITVSNQGDQSINTIPITVLKFVFRKA
jgi:hypothetical protein